MPKENPVLITRGAVYSSRLLKMAPWLKVVLGSRFFPAVLQWPALIVFGLIIFELLTGAPKADENLGSALTWLVWWPALTIMFLLFGRIWCTVCPFSLISDLTQKLVGNNLPVPRFLKKHGLWIMISLLVVLTWTEEVFAIVHSPKATAILLLVLIVGVVASGAFLRRRSWCRYLCPLGGMAVIYARMGALELRGTPEQCVKCDTVNCYKGVDGAPGCPMFEFPRVLDSNAYCNFCGQCVKNCPNDSIRIMPRPPAQELWTIRSPRLEVAFGVAVLAGVVATQNIMEKYGTWVYGLMGAGNDRISFTVFYILCLAVPVLLMTFAGKAAALFNATYSRLNFTWLGYSFIPLVLATHISHNMADFLEDGRLVPLNILSWLGFSVSYSSPELAGEAVTLFVQSILLAAGFALAIYVAYRLVKNNYSRDKVAGTLTIFGAFLALYMALNLFMMFLAE